MLLFTTWWLPLSLVGVLFYSVAVIVEKYTVDEIFEDSHSWMIGVCLTAFLSNTFFVMALEGIQPLPLDVALLAALAGALLVPSSYAHVAALRKASPDVVSAVWQTTPLYALLVGFLVFGEPLSFGEIAGIFIIVTAAIWISTKGGKTAQSPLKNKNAHSIFITLQVAIVFYILSQTIVDRLVSDYSVLQVIFYGGIGFLTCGLGLSLFAQCRKPFISTLKTHGKQAILFLSAVSVLEVIAEYYFYQAYAHGKFALVSAMGATLPISTAFLLLIMQKYWPHTTENVPKATFLKRFASFIMIVFGVYLLAA